MCDYCSWIEGLLSSTEPEAPVATICTNVVESERKGEKVNETVKSDATILVHGTADSTSSREEINELLVRIEEATLNAYKELINGAETVDAVEIAIRQLENEKSSTELADQDNRSRGEEAIFIRDAAIMDNNSNAGSVGAVTNHHNPITLAKKVLRNTDHVLIVGTGIENLHIDSNSATEIDASEQENKIELRAQNFQEQSEKEKNCKGLKLYGAIARDRRGRMSCGISTFDDRKDAIARSSMSASGTVLGCGIFAEAQSCCTVSGTDTAVYKYAPARKVVERLNREFEEHRENSGGSFIDEILKDELKQFVDSTGETSIGIAALNVEGDARVVFESNYFPWACCNYGKITSGCVKGEVSTKNVEENLDMPLDCECH